MGGGAQKTPRSNFIGASNPGSALMVAGTRTDLCLCFHHHFSDLFFFSL
jgi:hypothetical protein